MTYTSKTVTLRCKRRAGRLSRTIERTAACLAAMAAVLTLPHAAAAAHYARFDQQTDTIQVPGNTVFLPQSNWTIEARVMFCNALPGGNHFNVIYQEQYNNAEDKALDGHTSGFLGTAYPADPPGYLLYPGAITPEVWHHLAFVGDASEERLYLDGVKVASRPRSMAIADDSRSTRSIGGFREPAGSMMFRPGFLGLIDTLRVSDGFALYNANFTPPTGDLTAGPQTVLLYNFNEPAGAPMEIDESGFGFNGIPGSGFTGATPPTFGVCGCGPPVCGDGCVDAGEQCDDGNTADGDCCSSTCQFEAASSPCPADGNVCTDDVCDGAGTCGVPNTGPCPDDGNVCTDDMCDGAGNCGVPNADPCDDDDACTGPDVCSGGSCGGPLISCDDGNLCTQDSCDSDTGCVNDPVPVNGCKAAGKSQLQLKNDSIDDSKDQLKWKWQNGAATTLGELGNPTAGTEYALCLYAGTASATVAIPPGSGWKALSTKGFKFKDSSGIPDGAQKAQLKTGGAGKSKVFVRGKGANLPDTVAPMLPLPVTVQLVNDTNSTCFEAVYDSADVKKNDAKQFKAFAK